MRYNSIIVLTALSAIMMAAGVLLSVLGVGFRFKQKNPFIINAEIGLIVIQALSFLSTTAQLIDMIETPPGEKMTVWIPTVVVRVLFFWVPLNYYLYVRNEKKKLKITNN